MDAVEVKVVADKPLVLWALELLPGEEADSDAIVRFSLVLPLKIKSNTLIRGLGAGRFSVRLPKMGNYGGKFAVLIAPRRLLLGEESQGGSCSSGIVGDDNV